MSITSASCDICGSSKVNKTKMKDANCCEECNHIFVFPFPSENEIIEEYSRPVYYKESSEAEEIAVKNLWKRRYESLKTVFLRKKGSFLDVGCGRGFILDLARKDGWSVIGTEYCEHTASYAKNDLKLSVLISDLLDLDFKEKRFDVVSMWHVLEHVKYPSKYIEKIGKLLKKDGVLIIEIPNIEEAGRDLEYHVSQNKTHYHFFSEKTLTALLMKNGFTILKISYENANCYKNKLTSKIHHEVKTLFIKISRYVTGKNKGSTIRLVAKKI